MADDDKNLRNAIKNAKSAFYTFKSKKKKVTRKEIRRAARVTKKTKQNQYQQKKYSVEDVIVEPEKTAVVQKKRKKKKKKKKVEIASTEQATFDNASYEAANKADEKLIASLGKKLGANKKNDRLAPVLKRDGLDYILEVCESFGADSKGYDSDEEYLASKSKKKKTEKKVEKEKMSEKEINEKLLFEDGQGSDEDEEIEEEMNVDKNDENNDDFALEELDDLENGDIEDEEDDDDIDDDVDDIDVGEDDIDVGEDDIDVGEDDIDDFGEDDIDDVGEDDIDDVGEDDIAVGEDDISDGYISDENEDEGDYEEKEDENSGIEKKKLVKVKDVDASKPTSKYIPPALRNQKSNDIDQKKLNESRIRKKLKGLLNRLSEGTIPGIVSELEEMYSNNGRNFMNEVLYEMISESCVSSITMPEKLVIQNMVIVTALQLLTNSEVGSYFLQMLAENFCKLQADTSSHGDKTCHNILLMLVCLYNLKVVHNMLIYDLINKCLESFTEQDISLIFLIVKSCGPEIRKDDPSALKEMIVSFRAKSAEIKTDDKSYINFMLEAIDALKNNNMRKIPLYDPSIVDDARKCLKNVVGKSKTIEVQLKVSLKDLIDADEKGRWWITGSAWTGRGPAEDTAVVSVGSVTKDFSATVLLAAKKQRMNTSIRKQIFCVMVSSEDYIDAFEKLIKLSLKEKQFREILHVLLDCCLQEKKYNPFYSHLANKFCDFSKSNSVTLQYGLWDRLKTISKMKKYSLTNMAQFLAHMIASKSLSLSVLKVVTFGALDEVSINFFKQFFTTFLLNYPQNNVKNAFQRIANFPKLSLLKQGIKMFLRHFLYPDDSVKDVEVDINKEKMKELIEIAELALDGCDYVPL